MPLRRHVVTNEHLCGVLRSSRLGAVLDFRRRGSLARRYRSLREETCNDTIIPETVSIGPTIRAKNATAPETERTLRKRRKRRTFQFWRFAVLSGAEYGCKSSIRCPTKETRYRERADRILTANSLSSCAPVDATIVPLAARNLSGSELATTRKRQGMHPRA